MQKFREILRTQWKWACAPVLLIAVAAFATPILSVRNAVVDDARRGSMSGEEAAYFVLDAIEPWSLLYTLLAAGLGLCLAMLAWGSDHRGKHVYALILPIERWRYALMRFSAGAVLLLVPAITLLIAGTIASATAWIPAGLSAYPVALAFRFWLASFVAYSIFFAISSGTTRSAAYVLAPIGILIVAQVALDVIGAPGLDIFDMVVGRLSSWPGLFEIFTGRWMLIDV